MSAMPGAGINRDFRLGAWVVQPSLCRISRDGRTVQVRAKVMDLLAYFAAHSGEVVSKDRLLDDVWGSQAISESALTRTVTDADSRQNPALARLIVPDGRLGCQDRTETMLGISGASPCLPLSGGSIR
jgi:hypothetical protein